MGRALLILCASVSMATADSVPGPLPLPQDEATLDSCLETRRMEDWGACEGIVSGPCLEGGAEDRALCHGRERAAWAALLVRRLDPALDRVAVARDAGPDADAGAVTGLPEAVADARAAWADHVAAGCRVAGFEGEIRGAFEEAEAACHARETARRAVLVAHLIRAFGEAE